jgi:antitoxin component YwqK of YwqJK toxin-antitoxin module
MKNKRISTLLVVLTLAFALLGCSLNRYKNNVRVGKWITINKLDTVTYKRVEHYKRGRERGTWKVYANQILESKEKYRRDTCYTTFYYHDGKISSTGRSTKKREMDGSLHWFYVGDWMYYDKRGKLELIRNYINGMESREIEIHR